MKRKPSHDWWPHARTVRDEIKPHVTERIASEQGKWNFFAHRDALVGSIDGPVECYLRLFESDNLYVTDYLHAVFVREGDAYVLRDRIEVVFTNTAMVYGFCVFDDFKDHLLDGTFVHAHCVLEGNSFIIPKHGIKIGDGRHY